MLHQIYFTCTLWYSLNIARTYIQCISWSYMGDTVVILLSNKHLVYMLSLKLSSGLLLDLFYTSVPHSKVVNIYYILLEQYNVTIMCAVVDFVYI